MPVIIRNDENTRGKAGEKLAFCYSQLGEFILMKNSYVTLNASNSCPASTKNYVNNMQIILQKTDYY